MSDILIHGMDMPKGDNTISITIFSNGKVSLAHDKKYAEYAEAVSLPEGHGRHMVSGKWLIDRGDTALCSKCGNEILSRDVRQMNFCPNCGADMRGGKQ